MRKKKPYRPIQTPINYKIMIIKEKESDHASFNLPSELIPNIIKYLSPRAKQLNRLLLVSKRWLAFSIDLIYHSPHLNFNSSELLLRTIESDNTYIRFIKNLTFVRDNITNDELLYNIIKKCTHVETLSVAGPLNHTLIAKMLLNPKPSLACLTIGTPIDFMTFGGPILDLGDLPTRYFTRKILEHSDNPTNALKSLKIGKDVGIDIKVLTLICTVLGQFASLQEIEASGNISSTSILDSNQVQTLLDSLKNFRAVTLNFKSVSVSGISRQLMFTRWSNLHTFQIMSIEFCISAFKTMKFKGLKVFALVDCVIHINGNDAKESINLIYQFASSSFRNISKATITEVSFRNNSNNLFNNFEELNSSLMRFLSEIAPLKLRCLNIYHEARDYSPISQMETLCEFKNLEVLKYADLKNESSPVSLHSETDYSIDFKHASNLVYLIIKLPNLKQIQFTHSFETDIVRFLFDSSMEDFESRFLLNDFVKDLISRDRPALQIEGVEVHLARQRILEFEELSSLFTCDSNSNLIEKIESALRSIQDSRLEISMDSIDPFDF